MDSRITKDRLLRHLEYDWLKYVAVIIAAVMLWWGIYSLTDKTEQHEKIDILSLTPQASNYLQQLFEDNLLEYLDDETIKECDWFFPSGQINASIMLATWGTTSDLVIADTELFERLIGDDYLVSLDTAVEKGYLSEADLTAAVISSDGMRYGVSLNALGRNIFFEYAEDTEYMLGVVNAGDGGNRGSFQEKNTENAQAFEVFRYIVSSHALYRASSSTDIED